MDKLYVQFGGHTDHPEGWDNYEFSPYLRAGKVPVLGKYIKGFMPFDFHEDIKSGSIVSGLPIKDATVDGLYCCHVLEHLTYEDALIALRNSYNYLKPGGVFRLVLPDLQSRCKYYVENYEHMDNPSYWLMQKTLLGKHEGRETGFGSVLKGMFSNSSHLWMWDEKALSKAVLDTGFSSVRRAEFGDSSDSMFEKVELKFRYSWSWGENGDDDNLLPELALECIK